MTEVHTPDPLWSPEDLASYLKLPEKTLATWRHNQKGPAWHRMGKHVRYRPEEVDAWLDTIRNEAEV